ncbi:ras-related protein RABA5b [Sesamum indicum]|uniref:Ras-related protein RABA5b n=1 Tax=Sesamum indicum TaxID=4182 RepID=A0A8M8V002_SESIN|nr:ras-related protein RABA5b [Sesamum indicum]
MAEAGGGEEYLFKIVVIGDSAVGKSNLLSRFARDEFDHNSKATIGVEFQTQVVDLDAHCDTTVARMLVGNKCDLENIREVSVDEGKGLAEEEGLFFIETSALDSTNVNKAFEIVIREIYDKVSRKILNSDSYKAELSVNRVSLANGVDLSKEKNGTLSCCSR